MEDLLFRLSRKQEQRANTPLTGRQPKILPSNRIRGSRRKEGEQHQQLQNYTTLRRCDAIEAVPLLRGGTRTNDYSVLFIKG